MAFLEKPRRYPQTQIFLTTSLPILHLTKPKVFQHFKDYTGLGPKDVRNIFLQDYPPTIKVKATGARYGWTPAIGDDIWLNPGFIKELESLLSGRSEVVSGYYDYYETKEFSKKVVMPKLFLLLEVTVLHELVHFGRKVVHGYLPDRNAEERIAQRFEKEAYGKVHSATSLGLNGIVSEPR